MFNFMEVVVRMDDNGLMVMWLWSCGGDSDSKSVGVNGDEVLVKMSAVILM